MNRIKIKIGRAVVKAEVANTLLNQMRGLMLRKNLRKNDGMFFIFNWEGYHTIWMMGMRFPIDIIWIGKDRRVVDFAQSASPYNILKVYIPKKKAKYVLEVSAGFVKKNKIKVGTKVQFKK